MVINCLNLKSSSVPVTYKLANNNINRNVSFTGNTDSFETSQNSKPYIGLKYLENETVVSQNPFSTTIIDKNHKRSILEKLLHKQYTKTVYDLPIRLHEELSKANTDILIQNTPQDVLDKTKLTNKQLSKRFNEISALIELIHPQYDTFEDKTKQSFDIKLGDATARFTRLTQGMSGVIYKIEVPDCKPLALKYYLNNYLSDMNSTEGAFPEIAFAQRLNKDKVKDIPALYYANPYNGWSVSEFIDKDTKLKDGSSTYVEYVTKNKILCDDINTGMVVKNDNGVFFVDFGYLRQAKSSLCPPDVLKSIFDSRCKKYDNIPQKEITLSDCENIVKYGSEKAKLNLTEKCLDNTGCKIYMDTYKALSYVLNHKEIPDQLSKNLQEEYEKFGIIGNAAELIKSANQ